MEDKLVTFETAKLAKEKGFNWKSYFYYMENTPNSIESAFNKNNTWDFNFKDEYTVPSKSITAPTQALLQKWLREVHNIQVYASSSTTNEGKYKDYTFTIHNITSDHRDGYDTYEEALEVGLIEGLKLIPDVQK